MRISKEQAREYFADPSQLKEAFTDPDQLPEWAVYYAEGPICGVFHAGMWPGVVMAHYGVKPEGWGHLKKPTLSILREFWAEHKPAVIVGWTNEENRAAIAFAKRLGFKEYGRLVLEGGTVIMQEWREWA